MKYGYIEKRVLFSDDLRSLCCLRGWYTCGTSSQYDRLLSSVKDKVITTDDIVEIATDIIEHSNNVSLDNICSVMRVVEGACWTSFLEV